MKPVSLYIHIPFCTSKCHYCSFNSVTGQSRWITRYIEALQKEAAFYQPALKDRKIETLFFGGGTPSLLCAGEIKSLIQTVHQLAEVSENAEISLESNPGTLDLEKLIGYFSAGVNRISMGVQSFKPDELRWLGRNHSVEEVIASAENIHKAGFKNFNLDLIFGLPGQTLTDWQNSVEKALALVPTHISLYHLTIEEGSAFGDIKKLASPSGKLGAELFSWTRERLHQAGFEQYEVSNYARPGFRCRHNEIYWKNRDSIGIGAGAWTFLNGTRYLRPKTIEEYVKDVENGLFQRLEEETLPPHRSMRETLVFGLRTRDGVNLSQLQQQYRLKIDSETRAAIERLEKEGLLELAKEKLKLTDKGFLFADTVSVELI